LSPKERREMKGRAAVKRHRHTESVHDEAADQKDRASKQDEGIEALESHEHALYKLQLTVSSERLPRLARVDRRISGAVAYISRKIFA
jgi:hypothetical protein